MSSAVTFLTKSNPLRWDCKKSGCFNVKKRPKINQFADCFPHNIAMGDVDGLVEINGFFLLLEWKSQWPVPTGQHILYERLTEDRRFVVVVVIGDAETMAVREIGIYKHGYYHGSGECSLSTLKERLSRWARLAQKGIGP